jgi:hypothetical protein
MAVGPLNANLDKLNNGDWDGKGGQKVDSKVALEKFQQSMMANFFKQHVETAAKSASKRNKGDE